MVTYIGGLVVEPLVRGKTPGAESQFAKCLLSIVP